MKKYALIQNEKIIKFRNISDEDNVITPKLHAHGYLPVEDQKIPVYDNITQTLSDSYEVQENKVLRTWTVKERNFGEAKQTKIESVESKVLDDIKLAFGEMDQDLQVAVLLSTKDMKIAEIEAAKTNEDLRNIESGLEV